MKQSFQVGVNTIYNKIVSCGQTPSDKSPTSISNAIQDIYNNRYNEGYNAGKADNPISKGALIAQFKGNQYHNYTDIGNQSGAIGFDCSRIWISCAGFTNHNALLLVYNSSGTTLTTISLNNNGNYEWNGSGIRSWNISYNYPSGHPNINFSYIVNMYY